MTDRRPTHAANPLRAGLLLAASSLLAACGSGGSAGGGGGCTGFCATDTPQNLTSTDVQQVISQVVAEARARNVDTVSIAVSDRVGNILAVYLMTATPGAPPSITITSTDGDPNAADAIAGGLENINYIPGNLGAIAKAITGAYLSTEGNAFSTRTANQIVQDHFNPGELRQPGGPLFGVQFSQLPCSDLNHRFANDTATSRPGPKRSPLGFSADPGGFPLYKNGVPVGGVGVMSDGIYGLDKDLSGPLDVNQDELLALAGTFGFEAPIERQAERITVDGKVFRYSDSTFRNLRSNPANAPAFLAANGAGNLGILTSVTGYYDGPPPPPPPPAVPPPIDTSFILDGETFGTVASGIVSVNDPAVSAATTALFGPQDAFVLLDATGEERFPPMAGTDAADLPVGVDPLSQAEVETILQEALAIAARGRAQIRRPLGSPIAVSLVVVDTRGTILGLVRTRDGPVFGIDVALQKARTATVFSSPQRRSDGSSVADRITALPNAQYLNETIVGGNVVQRQNTPNEIPLGDYVTAAQNFIGTAAAVTNPANVLVTGDFAFADRSGGNLSRPFFPDGVDGNSAGPFSKPAGEWSVFSDGLQLDLVYNSVIKHVLFSATGGTAGIGEINAGCLAAGAPRGSEADRIDRTDECNCIGQAEGIAAGFNEPGEATRMREIANGIQIFPGSVPIYRGDDLIGGIGISGDGVDQDDMIAFLGVHNAGERLRAGGATNPPGNAPPAKRADNIAPVASDGNASRLRYINCPQSPFTDSDVQEVCDGK